jgi:Tfp pilus assembly protein PilO
MADLAQFFEKLAFTLRQLSWQAQLGLALWLTACLLAFWLMSALQTQRNLEASLANATLTNPVQKLAAARAPQQENVTRSITQQFYGLLPKNSEIDALSEQILREADGMGLQFERAEFSEIKPTETALMQHQVKLPVRGNYVQIRQFLNGLLNTQPALALTEFNVRRDDVFSDLVEANLVLTLYLRGDAK